MQKKILAVAIAGLVSGASTVALADTANVNVYGIIDNYIVSGKSTATLTGKLDANGNLIALPSSQDYKFTGVNSGGLSGSRLGVTGTEDLGGGTKGLFVLELGTLDTTSNGASGNGTGNWRQALVGLKGDFGTFALGRGQTAGYDFGVKYDPMGASVFSPVGQLTDNMGTTLITGRGAAGRANNAVAYQSPDLSGVTVKVQYAFGEQVDDGTVKPQTAYLIGADYDNGPLSVGVIAGGIGNVGGKKSTDVTEVKTSDFALGAKYNFGMVTPFVTYQTNKVDNYLNEAKAATATAAAVPALSLKQTVFNIGVNVTAGANGVVKAAIGTYKDDLSPASKATSFGVDYEYSMSKRTTLYVGYSQLKNDKHSPGNYALATASNSLVHGFTLTNLGPYGGAALYNDPDQTASQFALGVRHSF